MSYYTLVHKCVVCPYWNISIMLEAKYHFVEDSESPHEARFVYAKCPIIENSRLPLSKQEPEYKLLRCPYDSPCEFVNSFKKTINISKDGYHQK